MLTPERAERIKALAAELAAELRQVPGVSLFSLYIFGFGHRVDLQFQDVQSVAALKGAMWTYPPLPAHEDQGIWADVHGLECYARGPRDAVQAILASEETKTAAVAATAAER